MEIEYADGQSVSLPLCQECADHLQKNPALALDLKPLDVLELDNEDDLGNLTQQSSSPLENRVRPVD